METVKIPSEQRTVLHNISWETYEHLLADHRDRSSPRFAYDRGVLEIMVVSSRHERPNRLISLLVELVAEEMELDLVNLGSTTFRHEDLQRGFEPDTCFYVQNEERVRGKVEIDSEVDPPPDLVIEVDITSPSLDRFPIYAHFGVPEVWRYDGERIVVYELRNMEYVEVANSLALPWFTSDILTRLVAQGLTMRRTSWARKVREWARSSSETED
jgi:Uma2 family endonuclease